MLEHGGWLRAAAREYAIPLSDWLDLSTAINPAGWPVPPIPQELWARLPEADDELAAAASRYYGTPHVLPVAGSQAAIQALPTLRRPARVAVMQPSYAEHACAWQRAGHRLSTWHAPSAPDALNEANALDGVDVLIVVNPNNPDGIRFSAARLLDWHARLAARGGWLVVDEAFIDATPEHSLAAYCERPGLIVLRSLGKFFGLAGARVGFALAEQGLLHNLEDALGPWPITGPSRWLAARALGDHAWQDAARPRLAAAGARLANLLATHGLPPGGGCPLFQWVIAPHAADVHHQLARRGILVRHFATPPDLPSLRFGLPASESGWARLEAALAEIAACKP